MISQFINIYIIFIIFIIPIINQSINIFFYLIQLNYNFLLFFLLLIFLLVVFHGLFLFYAFLIGKKLDDINFTVSWRILLIPLYIACAIIVLWGLVYIFSIKQDKTKYRWILIITIVWVVAIHHKKLY